MNPGDVVRLKSGSPRMTVKKVEDGLVSVVWFEVGSGGQYYNERAGSFPEVTLRIEDETPL